MVVVCAVMLTGLGKSEAAVTVRVKIFVILGVMTAAMLGALYVASDYVILNRFIALEKLNTQETMNVVREGFNDELEKLDKSNSDLSVYDGTWEAMAGKDSAKIHEFIHSLLADSKGGWQAQQTIQYVIFADAAGRVVWATGYDAAREDATAVPADLVAHVHAGDALLGFRTPQDKLGGVMLLKDGPVLIVSRPIVKTNYDGPIQGTLVTARRLDERAMRQTERKNARRHCRCFRLRRKMRRRMWRTCADICSRRVLRMCATRTISGSTATSC